MTRRTTHTSLATLALGITIAAVPLRASDPIGVYGLVDRVVVTAPAGGNATAQIWGTFSVAVRPPTSSYKPEEAYGKAAKGYLFFTCPAGKAATCDAEWNDLKSLAGTGQTVGFGSRWGTATTVRPADQQPFAPDVYSLNVGVVKMGPYGNYPSIVADLKAATGR
jgi:hypothetical protein